MSIHLFAYHDTPAVLAENDVSALQWISFDWKHRSKGWQDPQLVAEKCRLEYLRTGRLGLKIWAPEREKLLDFSVWQEPMKLFKADIEGCQQSLRPFIQALYDAHIPMPEIIVCDIEVHPFWGANNIRKSERRLNLAIDYIGENLGVEIDREKLLESMPDAEHVSWSHGRETEYIKLCSAWGEWLAMSMRLGIGSPFREFYGDEPDIVNWGFATDDDNTDQNGWQNSFPSVTTGVRNTVLYLKSWHRETNNQRIFGEGGSTPEERNRDRMRRAIVANEGDDSELVPYLRADFTEPAADIVKMLNELTRCERALLWNLDADYGEEGRYEAMEKGVPYWASLARGDESVIEKHSSETE
jgi:hypothetical protein